MACVTVPQTALCYAAAGALQSADTGTPGWNSGFSTSGRIICAAGHDAGRARGAVNRSINCYARAAVIACSETAATLVFKRRVCMQNPVERG